MRIFLPLTILACAIVACSVASAREVRTWSYEQLTKAAEFIVIATPVEVRDYERATVPVTNSPGFRVHTTFEVLSVLKGDKNAKKFVLDHFRHDDAGAILRNGANLISFNPKEKKRYLLFLNPEVETRPRSSNDTSGNLYSSVTGQTDPVDGIKDLGTDH